MTYAECSPTVAVDFEPDYPLFREKSRCSGTFTPQRPIMLALCCFLWKNFFAILSKFYAIIRFSGREGWLLRSEWAWFHLGRLFLHFTVSVHILYVDESGHPDDPSQKHFVLGGVSVFERQTYWIDKKLNDIVARFNPEKPWDVELHGSHMHDGKGY